MIYKIGDIFEESFYISQELHKNFIALFNDRNPLHTNKQYAILKGFNGLVMHGNILNGFLSYFIGECLPTKDVIIHSQEIQYKNPVYLNDKLQFVAKVYGISESVNVVQFKYDFINNSSKTVAKGKIQIGLLK